ncbi:MAG: hypothetical protein RJA70_183 [Pseudomonadota bacterium]|jgi:hypothetical protein
MAVRPHFTLSLLGLLLLVSQACQKAPPDAAPSPTASASAALPPAAPVLKRGEPLGDAPQHALSEILLAPQSFAGKTVRTSGQVRKACSAKGCWMELSTSMKKSDPGCRVTFKDYGFFVPLDATGSKATLEGAIEIKTVKRSYVEHYEGEGATFASKNADGTATEVQIVASGVELIR